MNRITILFKWHTVLEGKHIGDYKTWTFNDKISTHQTPKADVIFKLCPACFQVFVEVGIVPLKAVL